VTRLAIRVFIALIALNAALAIAVLLAGDFGDTEGKILLSSLATSGAVVLALACEAGRDVRRLGRLPTLGAVAAIVGATLAVISIWSRAGDPWSGRLAGTLITLAAVIMIVGFVLRAILPRRFQWTVAVTVLLASLVGAMLVSLIWGEWDNEWFARVFGAVAVALAAFGIVLPVLHRTHSREIAATAGPARTVNHCPSCGRPHVAAAGEETTCRLCNATFVVRFSSRPGVEPDREPQEATARAAHPGVSAR
jgi:hypothetical protein